MQTRALHVLGAVVLLLASAGLAWVGQPDPMQRWRFIAPELEPQLSQRQVQIEPAELMELMHNDYIDLQLIDVRDERDWNLFHLWGAQRIPLEELLEKPGRFARLPVNTVIVLISNDEARATQAWQLLMANASRPNAYILAGGINRWLDEFAPVPRPKAAADDAPVADETLRHVLPWALGSRHPAALPDPHHVEVKPVVKKVRLQQRVVKKGGCG